MTARDKMGLMVKEKLTGVKKFSVTVNSKTVTKRQMVEEKDLEK